MTQLLRKPGTWSIKKCPNCDSRNIENKEEPISLQRNFRYNICVDCGVKFILRKGKIEIGDFT